MDNYDKLVVCVAKCPGLDSRAEIAYNLQVNKTPSKSNAVNIDQALHWSSTAQGHTYWSAVHDHLCETWGYDYNSKLLFETLRAKSCVEDSSCLSFLSTPQQEY